MPCAERRRSVPNRLLIISMKDNSMDYYALIVGISTLWFIGALYSDSKKVLKLVGLMISWVLLLFLFFYFINANYIDMFTLKIKSRTVGAIAFMYGCVFGALSGVAIKFLFQMITSLIKGNE